MKYKLLFSQEAANLCGYCIARCKDTHNRYIYTAAYNAVDNWRESYMWKDTVEVIELEDNSYTVDTKHNKFDVPVQKWSEYVFHPARWNKNS